MDKRAVAIKCFVYAMQAHVYWNVARRTSWIQRGLRLWQEATGEDTTREQRIVQRSGATYGVRKLIAR